MHLPHPTPDNHVETRFDAEGAGTLMTLRMTLLDAETRASMLATGMEHGMEASYQRLEAMLWVDRVALCIELKFHYCRVDVVMQTIDNANPELRFLPRQGLNNEEQRA